MAYSPGHAMASKDSKPDHIVKLTKGLNNLRKQNEFCDVTIKVGKRTFHAHKNVLAADNNYFYAMFTHGFKESTESQVKIDGEPEIFEILLDYIYTGKLEITVKTMCDVLEMACYMGLTDAAEECAKFMKSQFDLFRRANSYWRRKDVDESIKITVADIFKISQLAGQEVGLEQLTQAAGRVLCEQFQKLKCLDLFLETASHDFLEQFLKRKDLSSQDKEKEVLEMVVKWLKYDWDNRRSHAASLLQEVRLGLVPEESLTQLLDSELLTIPGCQRLFKDAMEGIKSGRTWLDLAREIPHLFATRNTITAPIAMSSGDSKDSESNKMFYYDVDDHQWKELGDFSCMEYCPSLIVAGGNLFAVGGLHRTAVYWMIDVSDDSDDEYAGIKRMDFYCAEDVNFLQYDDKNNSWNELPFSISRHSISPVYLDGLLYAIGGVNNNEYLVREVECYNRAKDEWNEVAHLPEEDSESTVSSAIAYQGKILVYVVGSVGDTSRSGKQVILMYDPSTDVWQTKLCEDHGQLDHNAPIPILFLHNGVCYKVSSFVPYMSLHTYNDGDVACRPTVHILDIGKDVSTVSLGKEINQDLIPYNTVGAFRIQNEVFLNVKGSVYKTDIKICDGQKGKVNLGKWKNMGMLKNRQSNIINYTFDLNKLSSDDDDY